MWTELAFSLCVIGVLVFLSSFCGWFRACVCVCRRICALQKRSFVAMETSRPWCLADNSTPSQVILPSPLCPSKKLETELCFRGKIEVVFSSFPFLVSLVYFYFWLFGFFSRSHSQWGFQKMREEHCFKSIRRWISLSCRRGEPKLTANIRHPSYFHLSA